MKSFWNLLTFSGKRSYDGTTKRSFWWNFFLSSDFLKPFFWKKQTEKNFQKIFSSYLRTIACRYDLRGTYHNRGVVPGVAGGRSVNLILTGGGADYAHQILALPDFQTFLRPCYISRRALWRSPQILFALLHITRSFDGTGFVSSSAHLAQSTLNR